MTTLSASALVFGSGDAATLKLVSSLSAEGADVRSVDAVAAAVEAIEDRPADAVFVVWSKPAEASVRALSERCPDAWVVAWIDGDVREAVEAMRAGASDVVLRSASGADLRHALEKAVARVDQRPEEPPSVVTGPSGILGSSEPMQRLFKLIERAAPSTTTVLVRGESGTGKELVARAIHDASPRSDQPFVPVQCGALPETLLESELFGYEKGAFTGATGRKPGRVEVADGGTLFLDEIGDISPATQVKLLRLLQEKKYERLGGNETRAADVRFVAATHRDLEAMVKKGEFREDLFYRLNVIPLWLPPLRARGSDVEQLVRHFASRFSAESSVGARFSDEAVAVLAGERWPGNVRQLQNFVERVIVLSDDDVISKEAVRRELGEPRAVTTHHTAASHRGQTTLHTADITRSQIIPLTEEVNAAEKKALARALKYTRGNRTLAARILGISRATLYNKLVEHGLS